ncbi:MAG: dienelactone hydrolase family protein [Terriglobales bacterium]
MRTLLISTCVVLLGLAAFAAEGKPVTFPSGSETANGILYRPAGNGPYPALVVIQEYWGLNDWIKEQASRLTDQGYVTLAVDLYRGKVSNNPDEAYELMRGLPPDRAHRDLLGAFQFLKTNKDVKSNRIGAIGWCMGGGYALDLALREPALAATVINYGHLSTDPDNLKNINGPILGIFGAQDRGIPVSDVRQFEKQLKAAGKKVEIVIYNDAGHAFENPNNKGGYRPADAADAWKHTVAFLQTNLKK